MRVVIDEIGIKAISAVVPKQKRGYDDLAKIMPAEYAKIPV